MTSNRRYVPIISLKGDMSASLRAYFTISRMTSRSVACFQLVVIARAARFQVVLTDSLLEIMRVKLWILIGVLRSDVLHRYEGSDQPHKFESAEPHNRSPGEAVVESQEDGNILLSRLRRVY